MNIDYRNVSPMDLELILSLPVGHPKRDALEFEQAPAARDYRRPRGISRQHCRGRRRGQHVAAA